MSVSIIEFVNGDEKERNEARALKLQRKQRLEALVVKRKNNFSHLKKVHHGGKFWLNVALFTEADIKKYGMLNYLHSLLSIDMRLITFIGN